MSAYFKIHHLAHSENRVVQISILATHNDKDLCV